MKTIKLLDIIAQIALIAIAIILGDMEGFMLFYFGVGSLQVISCVVHAICIPSEMRNNSRQGYERILIIILIIGVLIFYFMLIIGILMAIWYLATCIYELATEDGSTTSELETI